MEQAAHRGRSPVVIMVGNAFHGGGLPVHLNGSRQLPSWHGAGPSEDLVCLNDVSTFRWRDGRRKGAPDRHVETQLAEITLVHDHAVGVEIAEEETFANADFGTLSGN